MFRSLLGALFSLGLVACQSDDAQTELVELADIGVACVWQEAPESNLSDGLLSFVADAPAEVQVILENCASGCATDVEATCDVTESAGVLEVTAGGSYSLPTGDVGCDDICVPVTAICPTSSLSAGSYALSYAGESAALTVPDEPTSSPCTDAAD